MATNYAECDVPQGCRPGSISMNGEAMSFGRQGSGLNGESTPPEIGLMLTSGSAAVVGRLSSVGLDFLVLDQQHGFQVDSLDAMCTAAQRVPVLVRVASESHVGIERALDSGASGVVVPMIEDGNQATQLMRSCQYAPDGERSYGLRHGASAYGGSTRPANINARIRCFAMVESKQGLNNVAAIAASGVSGIFAGPIDLAIVLGIDLDAARTLRDASLRSGLREIVAACNAAGVIPGIFAPSMAAASECIQFGFRMIAIGTDLGLVSEATKAAVFDLLDTWEATENEHSEQTLGL